MLFSIFLEKMHNRGLMRSAAVAAAAPPRHRAFLAATPAAGVPRDARSRPSYTSLMPPPPRFLPHLPATPTEAAGFPPGAAASAAPRPARSADPCPYATAAGTTSPPPRPLPAGIGAVAA